MTFYASDSLNAWSSEWMCGVCASMCVCVEAETVSAGGRRKNFQGLIRELPEQDQSATTAELSMWR